MHILISIWKLKGITYSYFETKGGRFNFRSHPSKHTDWDLLKSSSILINLKERFSTQADLEPKTQSFIEYVRLAASEATPIQRQNLGHERNYPTRDINHGK